MAVIDTEAGMLHDVHPQNKRPIGERLALLARQRTYGEAIEGTSPTFGEMAVAGETALLRFDHVGSGLEARPVQGETGVCSDGSTLLGFTLAGPDGAFVPAHATILSEDTVAVTAPDIPSPVFARYGWANYPVMNLWSKEGLPAVPFRTDSMIAG